MREVQGPETGEVRMVELEGHSDIMSRTPGIS
jgi:hypothetical protein